MKVCRHCQRPGIPVHWRSLCMSCYKKPAIRCLYAASRKSTRRAPVADFNGPGKPCSRTSALPGTVQKLEVLAARVAAGQQLWHPADPKTMDGLKIADLIPPLSDQAKYDDDHAVSFVLHHPKREAS